MRNDVDRLYIKIELLVGFEKIYIRYKMYRLYICLITVEIVFRNQFIEGGLSLKSFLGWFVIQPLLENEGHLYVAVTLLISSGYHCAYPDIDVQVII